QGQPMFATLGLALGRSRIKRPSPALPRGHPYDVPRKACRQACTWNPSLPPLSVASTRAPLLRHRFRASRPGPGSPVSLIFRTIFLDPPAYTFYAPGPRLNGGLFFGGPAARSVSRLALVPFRGARYSPSRTSGGPEAPLSGVVGTGRRNTSTRRA